MAMERGQSFLTDPWTNPILGARDIEYLKQRAVSEQTAKAARLGTVSAREGAEALGRDGEVRSSGLFIPHPQTDRYCRIRLHDPGPGGGKFLAPKGKDALCYLPATVPAETWLDSKIAVAIVEGPIKALACCEAGVPTLGLGGAEMGHDPELWRENKTARLHPFLLEKVVWTGRSVTIVYDANRRTNPRVAAGEARLISALFAAGALVRISALPLGPGGADQGPDDFIAAKGAQAFRELVAGAVPGDPIEQIRLIRATEEGQAARVDKLFALLQDLPFLAQLSLGGKILEDKTAWELRPYIGKRRLAEAVAQFKSLLQGHRAKDAEEEEDEHVDPIVARLNEEYAIASYGSHTVILRERHDPIFERFQVGFLKLADFDLKYKNWNVQRGRQEMSAAAYWLRHKQRRQYDQIVFAPLEEVTDCYNLWRGFAIQPRQGSWALMRRHILEIICNGDEDAYAYVIAWLADGVQNPKKRPGTAIVLRGKEGTGKSIFCTNYGRLFGQHFLPVYQTRHLTGNFNAHLSDALIVYADEAFWAGDKGGEGALKALITEPFLNLERKGIDVVSVPNYIRLIMSSNNEWVVPAGLEARRFCVLDVSEERMQDTAYFQALAEEMNNGGREAMLYDLQHHDLSQVDLKEVPKTQALLEQKLLSLAPVQRFWYGRLMAGEIVSWRSWTEWTPTAEVHQLYLAEAGVAGDRRRKVEMEFSAELKKLVPGLEHDKSTVMVREKGTYGEIKEAQGRPRCFKFPPLAVCREAFSSLIKSRITWPSDEREEAPPF